MVFRLPISTIGSLKPLPKLTDETSAARKHLCNRPVEYAIWQRAVAAPFQISGCL
ncbi:hypothetical protein GCWU000324_00947 [Kingella oralis ATCC 51147]|uniref:Uncharacterized protein n=1 Tax=Kingella oralis ATCC 51147 TaxID=629741 RepID=C4GFN1_9NEIS|nr:hypothetical protein GCWU000324_00947 [Kingella oralis ATCC 51147]